MSSLVLGVILGVSAFAQPQPGASRPHADAPLVVAPAPQAPGPFHIVRTFDVGGEGGWDLLAVDSGSHRLFVSRGTRVMVIDTESGKVVGEVGDTAGVHGVALAPGLNKGFTSNGRAGTVTVFDLTTLKTLQTVKAGQNPDAILFEPVTKTVLAFNGRGKDATVINAQDGVVAGTVAIGGKPELAVADGAGKVYVNSEDTSEVVCIDPKAMKVEKRFPLAPGAEPSGLAIDPTHKRLFAACSNEKLVVLDLETGKVLATPSIGKGVDGAEYDAAGGLVLTSNGEGTLSVISTKDDKFDVVQTLPTAARAKTLAIDPKTSRVYVPSAEFEAPKENPKDASGNASRQRPAMKAGSFKIIVVGR
jgi:DNA-binding beta-propeller fold protein YncE